MKKNLQTSMSDFLGKFGTDWKVSGVPGGSLEDCGHSQITATTLSTPNEKFTCTESWYWNRVKGPFAKWAWCAWCAICDAIWIQHFQGICNVVVQEPRESGRNSCLLTAFLPLPDFVAYRNEIFVQVNILEPSWWAETNEVVVRNRSERVRIGAGPHSRLAPLSSLGHY